MTKKEKIILSSIIITIGTIFNLYFTASLHNMPINTGSSLELIPLWRCILGLFKNRQQFMLFLSFEGFIVLCNIAFFLQNNRPYQSELVEVAKDIMTPKASGQLQHGSARWLSDEEKDQVFESFVLDKEREYIRELIDKGYDDLDFMKN